MTLKSSSTKLSSSSSCSVYFVRRSRCDHRCRRRISQSWNFYFSSNRKENKNQKEWGAREKKRERDRKECNCISEWQIPHVMSCFNSNLKFFFVFFLFEVKLKLNCLSLSHSLIIFFLRKCEKFNGQDVPKSDWYNEKIFLCFVFNFHKFHFGLFENDVIKLITARQTDRQTEDAITDRKLSLNFKVLNIQTHIFKTRSLSRPTRRIYIWLLSVYKESNNNHPRWFISLSGSRIVF